MNSTQAHILCAETTIYTWLSCVIFFLFDTEYLFSFTSFCVSLLSITKFLYYILCNLIVAFFGLETCLIIRVWRGHFLQQSGNFQSSQTCKDHLLSSYVHKYSLLQQFLFYSRASGSWLAAVSMDRSQIQLDLCHNWDSCMIILTRNNFPAVPSFHKSLNVQFGMCDVSRADTWILIALAEVYLTQSVICLSFFGWILVKISLQEQYQSPMGLHRVWTCWSIPNICMFDYLDISFLR